jgi:phosphatidylserine decarboxylase
MLKEVVIGIIAVILAVVLFWKFWFLRDPERIIPEGDNIVSPADGKVISIIELNKTDVSISKGTWGLVKSTSADVKDAKYLVSIFMTPLDVHIQRAPIDGRIASVKYHKGSFKTANNLVLENENNQILIEEDFQSVKVIQIAGFLARRIECFVKPGDKVVKGDRIGLINLGSQVTMILPKNVMLKVEVGDKVKAGETIIGELT